MQIIYYFRDDGEIEFENDFDLVNQMVADALSVNGTHRSGMSGAGKSFLSLFIIAICIIGSAFGFKYFEKRQVWQAREPRELSLEDVPYRDEPDQLPKIV